MTLVSIGKEVHKKFGCVDAFINGAGTCYYMIHRCPACGCNNALVEGSRAVMCIDCVDLRYVFKSQMRRIQRYNDRHIRLASDSLYEAFEETVKEYQRRRDAGLYAPSNLDQAVYMIEYWRKSRNEM